MADVEKIASAAYKAGIAGALMTALIVSYATCRQCTDGIEEAKQAAREERIEEQRALAEKRAALTAALCKNVGAQDVADYVIARVDGNIAYVRPEIWPEVALRDRGLLSAWVALCQAGEDDSIIVDGMTGETIAFWYLDHGYVPQ